MEREIYNPNPKIRNNLKMLFKKTKLQGVFIISVEPIRDKRGFFARAYCEKEFAKHDIKFSITQSSISYNKKKGTLRGMHYQIPPYAEEKLVSCIKGEIYDVIIDLRPKSLTYCQWLAVELSADNHNMLYMPRGFAHGFQTLCDQTMVYYQISEYYQPKFARGIRWDDPVFKIKWPIKDITISKKDQNYQLMKK